jgi:hypothetical protein
MSENQLQKTARITLLGMGTGKEELFNLLQDAPSPFQKTRKVINNGQDVNITHLYQNKIAEFQLCKSQSNLGQEAISSADIVLLVVAYDEDYDSIVQKFQLLDNFANIYPKKTLLLCVNTKLDSGKSRILKDTQIIQLRRTFKITPTEQIEFSTAGTDKEQYRNKKAILDRLVQSAEKLGLTFEEDQEVIIDKGVNQNQSNDLEKKSSEEIEKEYRQELQNFYDKIVKIRKLQKEKTVSQPTPGSLNEKITQAYQALEPSVIAFCDQIENLHKNGEDLGFLGSALKNMNHIIRFNDEDKNGENKKAPSPPSSRSSSSSSSSSSTTDNDLIDNKKQKESASESAVATKPSSEKPLAFVFPNKKDVIAFETFVTDEIGRPSLGRRILGGIMIGIGGLLVAVGVAIVGVTLGAGFIPAAGLGGAGLLLVSAGLGTFFGKGARFRKLGQTMTKCETAVKSPFLNQNPSQRG